MEAREFRESHLYLVVAALLVAVAISMLRFH